MTDTETGENKNIKFDLDWRRSSSLFWWRDGNFACDCNRGMSFYGCNDDFECNDGKNRFVANKAILDDGSEIDIEGDI
jgi:hypothetical protein